MLRVLMAIETKYKIIGKDNDLAWKIKKDMKWFKKLSQNSALIMGRKTFESLKGQLKNRFIVVVSRTAQKVNTDNVYWQQSVEDAIGQANMLREERGLSNVFVVGGAELNKHIFENYPLYIECMYITRVTMRIDKTQFEQEKDRYKFCEVLPKLQELVAVSQTQQEESIQYDFTLWINETVDLNKRRVLITKFSEDCCQTIEDYNIFEEDKNDILNPKSQSVLQLLKENELRNTMYLNEEYQYQNLVRKILEKGCKQLDRTQIGTKSLFGESLLFDLQKSYPLSTLKKMYFKGVFLELKWVLNGITDAKWLSQRGVPIWDANSSQQQQEKLNLNRQEGDIGPLYPFVMRFCGLDYKDCNANYKDSQDPFVDQLSKVIKSLKEDPFSRRHIISFWIPQYIEKACLPPCIALLQFNVQKDKDEQLVLNMNAYQRSVDVMIGLPWNIAYYALFDILLAHHLGYKRGTLQIFLGDTHIYNSHTNGLIVLDRQPFTAPQLSVNCPQSTQLQDIEFSDLSLNNSYSCWDSIKLPMEV